MWAEFAGRILPFSLAASLALSGAGFRTFFMPVAPSRLHADASDLAHAAHLDSPRRRPRGRVCRRDGAHGGRRRLVHDARPDRADCGGAPVAGPRCGASGGHARDHVGGHHGATHGVGVPGDPRAVGPRHSQQLRRLRAGARGRALAGGRRLRDGAGRRDAVHAVLRQDAEVPDRHARRRLVPPLAGTPVSAARDTGALATPLLCHRVPGGRAPAGDSAVVVHAWALSMAVVLAGLVFGGTGIRSGPEIAHRSVYYTLTLPVSRFMLAWTRLGTAAAIAFALVFGVFIAVVAALWWAGHAVPLGPLAASMLLGLAAAVSHPGAGRPGPASRDGTVRPGAAVADPVVVILSIVRTFDDRSTGWAHVVRFLEFQPERWDLIGALLLVIVCSLVTAAVLVRVRDFSVGCHGESG